MKKLTQYAAIIILFFSYVSALICVFGYLTGLRVNTTSSIPIGIYKIISSTPQKGDYILFCPPENEIFNTAVERGYIGSGFCPGGYGEMMKKILAAKGDEVFFKDDGVYVNGEKLPYSRPLNEDPSGRKLPVLRKSYKLIDNEFLLMSNQSEKSFDGRYFGVVTPSRFSAIYPILIW